MQLRLCRSSQQAVMDALWWLIVCRLVSVLLYTGKYIRQLVYESPLDEHSHSVHGPLVSVIVT